ncbi:epoxide hydrolase N-terminal domain-containing protein [Paraburkholderia largidicola]|uniref:Epoxide hydrolase N-terminal domain-containing protein n=1 Tax=Paraburkholderia largidicola TaxID=3014751 RepID=A0A7I8C594_9BURK|nr:epoxide hydrolase N-terminal domain-containing protein [Paraburkholderia sp. PGU16]BCF95060.1 hypothetical protein PPGU16_81270 [Paraburkholderia sp. PGU16]
MQGVYKACELVEYRHQACEWRRSERRLNSFPQFRTEIDKLEIHFIHARSHPANALPPLLTHGWPGSITLCR